MLLKSEIVNQIDETGRDLAAIDDQIAAAFDEHQNALDDIIRRRNELDTEEERLKDRHAARIVEIRKGIRAISIGMGFTPTVVALKKPKFENVLAGMSAAAE